MSYKTQAIMARDDDLLLRVSACAAAEGQADPSGWVYQRQWTLSTQPGWDEAYSKAVAAKLPKPGADETVITDSMILAAVQTITAAATP